MVYVDIFGPAPDGTVQMITRLVSCEEVEGGLKISVEGKFIATASYRSLKPWYRAVTLEEITCVVSRDTLKYLAESGRCYSDRIVSGVDPEGKYSYELEAGWLGRYPLFRCGEDVRKQIEAALFNKEVSGA